jgi:hypothetical protein
MIAKVGATAAVAEAVTARPHPWINTAGWPAP